VTDRLSHEETVSFTSDEFKRNPEACLKTLVDAGVIYVEDDSYLTLPVSELRRPPQADWVNFRIPGVAERFRRLTTAVRARFIDGVEIAVQARQGLREGRRTS